MHTLRRSVKLTRLVLAWFVLAVGAAVASPMVSPKAMELVCAAGGEMRLVVVGDDATASAVHQTLDCPMCLAATLPPPVPQSRPATVLPLAHALQPMAAAHIAAQVGAPLPPRGPPARS